MGNQIEERLEAEWDNMQTEVKGWNLSNISHRIFVAEKGLHELRYELNSEAGILEPPDLLWEDPLAERLYEQVTSHFDVRRRTNMLNQRLSYTLDYIYTLGDHVKHHHSVRLERMIIILIMLELVVG